MGTEHNSTVEIPAIISRLTHEHRLPARHISEQITEREHAPHMSTVEFLDQAEDLFHQLESLLKEPKTKGQRVLRLDIKFPSILNGIDKLAKKAHESSIGTDSSAWNDLLIGLAKSFF